MFPERDLGATMMRNCAFENPILVWENGSMDSVLALRLPGMTKANFCGDALRVLQCSDVYAAPSIGPGFSRLPSWI